MSLRSKDEKKVRHLMYKNKLIYDMLINYLSFILAFRVNVELS